jgi:putative ABC transport system substrate-binding protein
MTSIIGVLDSTSAASWGKHYTAFQRGLKEAGYVDGQNLTIEYRFAENDYSQLGTLAKELVDLGVKVLVAAGGPVAALEADAAIAAAKAGIPIVFTSVSDPVIEKLKQPGKKVTGIAGKTSELDSRRLRLLHQLIRSARLIGVLENPNRPEFARSTQELEDTAAGLSLKLARQDVGKKGAPGTKENIHEAIEALADKPVDALLVTADPFFNSWRGQIVAAAANARIPAIYQWREFAVAGGLMSYGPSIGQAYHQAGVYTGLILKGADATNLPIVEATRFDLVINRKAASALNLGIPPTLLALAEVIE